MVRSKILPAAGPVLASPSELDGDRVLDVCIGLLDGPGGRFRVLQRLRATLRDAVRVASHTANVLARANREKMLDPHSRPAAIRMSDDEEGTCLWLDYDVGPVSEGRPRVSRPMRLTVLAKQ